MEIIAGAIDRPCDKASIIRQEALEEANYLIEQLIPITSFLLSPGISTQKMHLYCGIVQINADKTVCHNVEENEDILVHAVAFEEVASLIYSDTVCNAATIIALQWLSSNRLTLFNS